MFKVYCELDPQEMLKAYSGIAFEESSHRRECEILSNMKFMLSGLKDLDKGDFTEEEWSLLEKNVGETIRANNGRRRVDWNLYQNIDWEKDYIFNMLYKKNYLDISNVKQEFDWAIRRVTRK